MARPSLTVGRVASLSGICSAALCNTAMNIIILKWVLADLRRVDHSILHAVSCTGYIGIISIGLHSLKILHFKVDLQY